MFWRQQIRLPFVLRETNMKTLTLATILCFLAAPVFAAEDRPLEKGRAKFEPVGDQKDVPERYRLAAHTFEWEMQLKKELPASKVTVYDVRFPSPFESKTPENNTVHAEYYRPPGEGKFPCVIVLDITAGDQSLSRTISTVLAQNKIAALFVQMAYYGPRRPKGSKLRLMSPNIAQTVEAVRQTVLDMRRATAWMEGRAEIDAKRLGILGTSLGSFVAALSSEMEPKLGRVAVLLGGGGLVDAYYTDKRAEPLVKAYEALGGTKATLEKMIAPVDPITCAANLKNRKLLIIAGKRDEIVPPKASTALWEASGKQQIVWYDCTHYGAALFFPSALRHVTKHFGNDDGAASPKP
jgi:dienelactone hydrolase